MVDDSLRERVESLVEELLREDSTEAAVVVSILLAAMVALRKKRLLGLSEAAWEFMDRR